MQREKQKICTVNCHHNDFESIFNLLNFSFQLKTVWNNKIYAPGTKSCTQEACRKFGLECFWGNDRATKRCEGEIVTRETKEEGVCVWIEHEWIFTTGQRE